MLSKFQIQHVATLARLKISDQEAEKYSTELSKVLDYVDQLQTVVNSAAPLDVSVGAATDRWRVDRPAVWQESERLAALEQADLDGDNLVKVPRVI